MYWDLRRACAAITGDDALGDSAKGEEFEGLNCKGFLRHAGVEGEQYGGLDECIFRVLLRSDGCCKGAMLVTETRYNALRHIQQIHS